MAYFFNRISYLTIFSFIAVLILFSAGCKNDSVVDPVSSSWTNNISIGYFNENAAGDNTLVLTEAKFLIRKIMLEREGHGEEGDNEVKLGPVIVYLDLSQKVVIAALSKIPTGSYDEVKFQIHKPNPNDNISDPDFTESTSRRFSVVVKGSYNGNLFIYKSDITIVKEVELENAPVTLTEATVSNVTIRLNVLSWFMDNSVILDPSDPQNNAIIKNNIKMSFNRAFKDMNHDGEPD